MTRQDFIVFGMWLVNGILAGVLFGLILGGGRFVLFGPVLGLGVVGLVFVRKYTRQKLRRATYETKPKELQERTSPGSARAEPPSPSKGEGSRDEVLSPDEAREWLDDFLVKQQAPSLRERSGQEK